MAAGAGVFWGSMGVGAQYLLHYCRFSALDLVSIRMVIAGTLFLILARTVFGKDVVAPLLNRWNFIQILIAGFAVLTSQLTFMLAISYSNAGTAAIMLTLVPLFCAAWLAFAEHRPLSKKEFYCFILATVGVFFIVTKGEFSDLDFSYGGVAWGLVSALFSAFYSIQPRKVIAKVGVEPVVGWGMFFAGIFACIVNPPWTLDVIVSAKSVAAFSYVVIVGTIFAFWCYLSSLKYISPVIVGLLVCLEPLTAYVLTVLFFGQHLGIYELFGICLVMANVIWLSIPDGFSRKIKE